MPDEITNMRRWPRSPETEVISTGDFTITTPDIDEDEIIYAIKADWPEGYAFYVFRVILVE